MCGVYINVFGIFEWRKLLDKIYNYFIKKCDILFLLVEYFLVVVICKFDFGMVNVSVDWFYLVFFLYWFRGI